MWRCLKVHIAGEKLCERKGNECRLVADEEGVNVVRFGVVEGGVGLHHACELGVGLHVALLCIAAVVMGVRMVERRESINGRCWVRRGGSQWFPNDEVIACDVVLLLLLLCCC